MLILHPAAKNGKKNCNHLRGLKRSYSCSIIYVGSLSSGPIFWGAEISAVIWHVPYSPTAATSTYQVTLTWYKSMGSNCGLITIMSRIWSSPGYTMCYFNLKQSNSKPDSYYITFLHILLDEERSITVKLIVVCTELARCTRIVYMLCQNNLHKIEE